MNTSQDANVTGENSHHTRYLSDNSQNYVSFRDNRVAE